MHCVTPVPCIAAMANVDGAKYGASWYQEGKRATSNAQGRGRRHVTHKQNMSTQRIRHLISMRSATQRASTAMMRENVMHADRPPADPLIKRRYINYLYMSPSAHQVHLPTPAPKVTLKCYPSTIHNLWWPSGTPDGGM
jgi:hypothetical protein